MWRNILGLKGVNKAWPLSPEPLALPTPTSRDVGRTHTVLPHVDMPSARTAGACVITDVTLTWMSQIPGEHRQAAPTSPKHTRTPLATQAHKHRCGKQHPLLLGSQALRPSCLCLWRHALFSSLSVGQSLCDHVTRESGRGARGSPRLVPVFLSAPGGFLDCGSAKGRREVSRPGLNSLRPVYSRPVLGNKGQRPVGLGSRKQELS